MKIFSIVSKKVSYLVALSALVLIGCPVGFVLADGLKYYGNGISLATFLDNLETVTWVVFVFIVVMCFIIAGVIFLTAQGDPAKVKAARSAVLWGIIGVLVGILAFSAELIMRTALGV